MSTECLALATVNVTIISDGELRKGSVPRSFLRQIDRSSLDSSSHGIHLSGGWSQLRSGEVVRARRSEGGSTCREMRRAGSGRNMCV